jgi:hypothetical protein
MINFRQTDILRVLWLVSSCCLIAEADESKAERRFIRRAAGCDGGLQSFMIETLALEKGRFVGTAEYEYLMHGRLPTIEGTLTPDGRFWPTVTAQVRADSQADWKTIERSPIAGSPATFPVQTDSIKLMLYLDLEMFRPFLGKMGCARFVLQNGEAASFKLEDLKALKDGKEPLNPRRGWSIESMDGGNIPAPFAKPPLGVAGISEFDGNLIGECVYSPADGNTSASVAGTRATDGKLWLTAMAQVASDYRGVWMTVGKCPGSGEDARITLSKDDEANWLVNLNAFRPWVGKYRYGRVVLDNGMSAIFELKNILPPVPSK